MRGAFAGGNDPLRGAAGVSSDADIEWGILPRTSCSLPVPSAGNSGNSDKSSKSRKKEVKSQKSHGEVEFRDQITRVTSHTALFCTLCLLCVYFVYLSKYYIERNIKIQYRVVE